MANQATLLDQKRRALLLRRITLTKIDLGVVMWGIEVLVSKDRYRQYRSVMEALLARAISREHSDLPLSGAGADLSQKAGEVLKIWKDDLLFLAVALKEATQSEDSRMTVDLFFRQWAIKLPETAIALWEGIRIGQRSTWHEIAQAVGLGKEWTHTPKSPDIDLYDHCMRVTPNPNAKNVANLAADLMDVEGAAQSPEWRKQIVFAAIWGENVDSLVAKLGSQFDQYYPEVVEQLTSDLLKDYWERPGATRLRFANAVKLTKMLAARFSLIPEEHQAKVIQAICEAKKCPWFWLCWQEVIAAMPKKDLAPIFIASWLTEKCEVSRSAVANPKHDSYEAIIKELPVDLKPVVASLPVDVAAAMAADYSLFAYHNAWTFLDEFGFPGLIRKNPSEYVSALRPVIEEGKASAESLTCILEVVDDNEARQMLDAWLKNSCGWTGSPFEDKERLIESFVAQLNRFNLAAAGTRLSKWEYMNKLRRGGYVLKPVDVIDEKAVCEVLGSRDSGDSQLYFATTHWWECEESTRLFLRLGFAENVVISSIIASLRLWNQEERGEWIEKTLEPELLSQPRLMREFCRAASTLEPEDNLVYQDGCRDVRRYLVKNDRFRTWMTEEERVVLITFVWKKDREHMMLNEADVLQKVLTTEELINYVLSVELISEQGFFPSYAPWVIELFRAPEARRRLVGFLSMHGDRINDHSFLDCAAAHNLKNPPVISRVKKMINQPHPPEGAVEFLRAV